MNYAFFVSWTKWTVRPRIVKRARTTRGRNRSRYCAARRRTTRPIVRNDSASAPAGPSRRCQATAITGPPSMPGGGGPRTSPSSRRRRRVLPSSQALAFGSRLLLPHSRRRRAAAITTSRHRPRSSRRARGPASLVDAEPELDLARRGLRGARGSMSWNAPLAVGVVDLGAFIVARPSVRPHGRCCSHRSSPCRTESPRR